MDKRKVLNDIPSKEQELVGKIQIIKCEIDSKEDVWSITVFDEQNMYQLSHCFN